METKPVAAARTHQHWYLLTGLLFGLAIGLVISLFILPLTTAEAVPAELGAGSRAEYRLTIAKAFASRPDLERARSRLDLLGDAQPAEALLQQAQELLAAGGTEEDARALAYLATMLSTDQ